MAAVPMRNLKTEERVVPKRQTAGDGGTQSSGPPRLRAQVAELPKDQSPGALGLGPTNDQVGRLCDACNRDSTPSGRFDRSAPGDIGGAVGRPRRVRVGVELTGARAAVA